VRVAAAAGVAFGGDQDVLAERGQVMAAEWAAVRRGLAIGRAAHRPPGRGRKARRHRSILAPVSSRSARTASLAGALALLGVGVALARAERERRAALRARAARSATLLADEPVAAGLERVMLGQLDLAIALLEDDAAPMDADGRTVHETRKAIKRLRALVRLLGPTLGRKRQRRESKALRDCARALAGARDAQVMVATLDALLERHPKLGVKRHGRSGAGVRRLHAQLLAEREQATGAPASGLTERDRRRAVASDLRAIRARVLEWDLRERPGDSAALFAAGLEGIYRKGRRRRGRARRREDLTTMHQWRKSVKDLRYAAETFERRAAKRASKSAKRLHSVARRADRLGELLGEEHDLALLAGVIRGHPEHFAGDKRTRKRLLELIARRRKVLRRRALREGERLYRHKPKAFVRRLRKAL
jgi:CHAD domain-containing protein